MRLFLYWGMIIAPCFTMLLMLGLLREGFNKKQKKWSPKIDETSEGFKRASQSRFRPIWGGQELQNDVKNDYEIAFESEKTDFWKSAYFIGPVDAGRLSRC